MHRCCAAPFADAGGGGGLLGGPWGGGGGGLHTTGTPHSTITHPTWLGGGVALGGLQDLLTQIPRNYTPTHHSPRGHSPTHHNPKHRGPTHHTPQNHTPTHHTPHTTQSQGGGGLAVQTKHELAPLSALGQSTSYNLATMETHTPRHTYLPAFLIGPMIKIFFLHLQKTCRKKGARPPKR